MPARDGWHGPWGETASPKAAATLRKTDRFADLKYQLVCQFFFNWTKYMYHIHTGLLYGNHTAKEVKGLDRKQSDF